MTPWTFIKGVLLLHVFCPSCKYWMYFLYLCKKYMYMYGTSWTLDWIVNNNIILPSGGEYWWIFIEPREMGSISRPAIHQHWSPEVQNCFSTKPVNRQRHNKLSGQISAGRWLLTCVHCVLQTSGYHRISWAWVANQSV